MIDPAQTARDVLSATVSDRLVATLDDRPFAPTAAQLAWVDGGNITSRQEDGPLARVVAGRYAALFADHVIGDMSVDGAPGAYIRIIECAREAFLQSLSLGAPADSEVLQWENEGGAMSDAGTASHAEIRARGDRVAAQ